MRFFTISLVNNFYDFLTSTGHKYAHVVSYKLYIGIIVIFHLFIKKDVKYIEHEKNRAI